jgi:hypothetical protein
MLHAVPAASSGDPHILTTTVNGPLSGSVEKQGLAQTST